MNAAEEVAIRIEGVSKDFRLPDEKLSSVKSHIVHPFKRRNYNVQHALKDINVEIKKGEFFGIVGRNGSGKSTLLKIIAGIYQPTKGKISVAGKLVPFIELGVGFNPELTGKDNVYLNGALLGFSKKQIDAQYDDIVDFAELKKFMNQKLKNYSSGMQVRLAFSMAVRAKADILLIDEVLAVGDADFQRKCFEYFKKLKKEKKTVVFVSHNMEAVREFCDKAMLIEKNKLVDIGDTDIITRKYSQLFIDDSNEEEIKSTEEVKRWGNNNAYIKFAEAKTEGDYIMFRADIEANKEVDKIIYGIHIIASDGFEITAMNNKMIHQPNIENIKSGDSYTIEWKMLNIFNDGKYSVTITLIDGLANTLDWLIDAAWFTVKRAQRSTTAVIPPLTVEVRNITK